MNICFSCPHGRSARLRRAGLRTGRGISRDGQVGLAGKSPKANVDHNGTKTASHTCVSPTWWLWRSGCTRSHSELGRETLQRQWYFVSRRGRVGRCQVCQTHVKSLYSCLTEPCLIGSADSAFPRQMETNGSCTARTLGEAFFAVPQLLVERARALSKRPILLLPLYASVQAVCRGRCGPPRLLPHNHRLHLLFTFQPPGTFPPFAESRRCPSSCLSNNPGRKTAAHFCRNCSRVPRTGFAQRADLLVLDTDETMYQN